jgi:hypothetical protein
MIAYSIVAANIFDTEQYFHLLCAIIGFPLAASSFVDEYTMEISSLRLRATMEYIAYLHKDKNSDYGVSFPDFPGCITARQSQITEIDRRARARGLTRSSYIVQSALKEKAVSR